MEAIKRANEIEASNACCKISIWTQSLLSFFAVYAAIWYITRDREEAIDCVGLGSNIFSFHRNILCITLEFSLQTFVTIPPATIDFSIAISNSEFLTSVNKAH